MNIFIIFSAKFNVLFKKSIIYIFVSYFLILSKKNIRALCILGHGYFMLIDNVVSFATRSLSPTILHLPMGDGYIRLLYMYVRSWYQVIVAKKAT